MITNDYEYRVALTSIQQAEEALRNADTNETSNPESDTAVRAGIEVQLQKLRARISQYEALRDGTVSEFDVDFRDLADALTFLRHASGMSQKELAGKLGLKQQQIHRYEAQEYEQASYARLQEIVWALGASIRVHVTVPNATHRLNAATIAQKSDSYSEIGGQEASRVSTHMTATDGTQFLSGNFGFTSNKSRYVKESTAKRHSKTTVTETK